MLMKDYKMSEVQAKAVLDMKLSKLAKLEKVEIESEKKELLATITELNSLLVSKDVQILTIRKRLEDIVKKYGDARRTELLQIETPKEDKEIEQVIPEDCVVVMSKDGMIKRVATKTFKPQRRNGKGNANISDAIMSIISTNTIDNLMLFTDKGKMYRMVVDNVPAGTNASKGANIKEFITMEPGEKVIAMTSVSRKNDAQYVVFFTKNGLIKKTAMEEYKSLKKSTGSVAIKLKEDDSIADVCFMNEEQVVLITKKGMSIRFAAAGVEATGRATMGVKAINLNEGDEVVAAILSNSSNENGIAIFTEKGYGKKVAIPDFVLQNRGGKGVIIQKVSDTTGDVAGAAAIIGQGAVDFAALAANAAVRIDHEQALRERPNLDLIFGQGSGGDTEGREHRGGHRHANQALTRELEELTAREVLVKETFLVRHGFLSSLFTRSL